MKTQFWVAESSSDTTNLDIFRLKNVISILGFNDYSP